MANVNSWISCKVTQPEKSDYYFVVYDEIIITMRFELEMDEGERWGYWHTKFDTYTFGVIDQEYESVDDENVTYWMPIPELPSEGER